MKKRILIVDDDIEILDMLKLTIRVWCPECQIILATNGLEALHQLERVDRIQPFDLILTDYEMPVMNGLDLARIVRAHWPDTRIILMSAGQFDKEDLQAEMDLHNVDGYVQKASITKYIKEFFQTDSGFFH